MSGVSAAPNESTLSGEVLAINDQGNGKFQLSFQVSGVERHYGPCFAEPGNTLDCFTFADVAALTPGKRVRAKVEFLGGPHKQICQLKTIDIE